MYLLRSLIMILALISFRVDASISIALKATPQAYWYGKAYNGMRSDNDMPKIPGDICYEACSDLFSTTSSAEALCFLSGILREDHPVLNKLVVWNYVKSRNLQISKKEESSIRSDNSIFKKHLVGNQVLLEKIKKFWGVADKNIYFYCFFSRMDEKQQCASGAWLANFVYGNDIYSIVLMCGPSLASNRMSLNEHLSVIAHEFSHAMCDAAFGREKFEAITSGYDSPNAVVAGWYLNEAITIVLGNGLFQEAVSKKKIDLRKEEYCAKGFAPALYDITKNYFDNSKSIDKFYLENAVKIFDKVHPHGYIDPNICLYHVHVICPDDMKEHEVISKISKKTAVSSFYCTTFSKLTNDEMKIIRNSNETIVVIFRDKKELNQLKNMLPNFDDKKPISLIHKNKRTYVMIKIDDKHSLEDRINELFSRKHS